VIQTTGVCNFGKLNYFLGKKAAQRGAAAIYPDVDFCRDPGAICRSDHPDLKWVAGLFYWLESVQPYQLRGGNYMRTLHEWVDRGADASDHTLIDMASGIVNRGCHDAPHEGETGPDVCGNGVVDAVENRRSNFKQVVIAMKAAGVWPTASPSPAVASLGGANTVAIGVAAAVLPLGLVAALTYRRRRHMTRRDQTAACVGCASGTQQLEPNFAVGQLVSAQV